MSVTVASIEAVRKSNPSSIRKAVNKPGSGLETNTANSAPGLECVPYIYYLVRFQKDQVDTKALIDLGSEVNAMHPAYAKKIGLSVQRTDVGAQKIDGSALAMF